MNSNRSFRKRFQTCCALLLLCFLNESSSKSFSNRTFVIDWKNDVFLKDGKPFRFISGSFHYFRAHPDTWQRKLRTMRAAGLNAVTTYVEWSLHNPKDGVYVWNGMADLEKFIEYAIAEDLLVILRPGPYICAEREMGGFPYWLLTKYPDIRLRTSDSNYLHEVRIWFSQLMPKMTRFLYGNGGPIIMVQVENEYGWFVKIDTEYQTWLQQETLTYVKDKAVLFTNDWAIVAGRGKIENVLITLDLGSNSNLIFDWGLLRIAQPKGPLASLEYYTGWLTHWGEPFKRAETQEITNALTTMLDQGTSVNFYMFYGGTNFGFAAGGDDVGFYKPDTTSYDYDAPMDEAGDPTPKYYALREVIGKYLPLPNIPLPPTVPKRAYGTIRLTACCTLLSSECRKALATGVIVAKNPKTFEALNQHSGLVLYETTLPYFEYELSTLLVFGLRDRAYIYVDDVFLGILSREKFINSLPINRNTGKRLQILVESQGRASFNIQSHLKGIIRNVKINDAILTNWTMTKFPFESYEAIEQLIEKKLSTFDGNSSRFYREEATYTKHYVPTLYYGALEINNTADLGDTYLDTTGWGKGILFVNDQNLGRYWPLRGPQVTLYVPREVLKKGSNRIVMVEYQSAPMNGKITFTSKPNLNGRIYDDL